MEYFLVGGAVRDQLLGLAVKDRDWVVVGATPQQMLDAGFKQVGADFPVFLHPETAEEYALARTERKQGRGYHGFAVYSAPDVTLEEDLKRRDLTINAMAQSMDGEIIDPYGGQTDLEARCLRHVSPAFSEDPLRILRTARFAARFAPLGFTVADDTMALMKQMVADGEADHLVAERVWQETQRALHENRPRVYFEVLRACHALAVVLPQINRLFDDPGQDPLGNLERAAELSDETPVRYAALIHGLSGDEQERLHEAVKVPNDCKTLAAVAMKMTLALDSSDALDAGAIRHLIDLGDGWRRPERFEQVLLVLQAVGVAPETCELLRLALVSASGVDPQALMQQGYKGKALGKAIDRERLERITSLLE